MTRKKEIKVIIIGEVTQKARNNYAKALARALIAEYGKENCQELIGILSSLK